MAPDKRGLGPNFDKDCAAIFRAQDRGLITDLEARDNLRIAGMILGPDELEIPDFVPPMPVDEPAYAAMPDDEGDSDGD